MIEADHHSSLHIDFGKFLPKLASYVNYLFAIGFNAAILPSTYNWGGFVRDKVHLGLNYR